MLFISYWLLFPGWVKKLLVFKVWHCECLVFRQNSQCELQAYIVNSHISDIMWGQSTFYLASGSVICKKLYTLHNFTQTRVTRLELCPLISRAIFHRVAKMMLFQIISTRIGKMFSAWSSGLLLLASFACVRGFAIDLEGKRVKPFCFYAYFSMLFLWSHITFRWIWWFWERRKDFHLWRLPQPQQHISDGRRSEWSLSPLTLSW